MRTAIANIVAVSTELVFYLPQNTLREILDSICNVGLCECNFLDQGLS